MTLITSIPYYIWNFNEFRAILQWKIWHDAVHTRDPESESMETQICFDFLEKTSRSFSMVIQELHPDLLIPVAVFYLILRGLDTIEDDMTIELAKKEPLLRNFHNILDQKGWKFEENGPKEKDRHLLMHFNYVIDEFAKIKPAYRAVIKDITDKMGNGMASYASNAEHNVNGVDTIEDYSLYCHYVAGLVGNGLTRLFVESGLANTALLERPHLQESMGQFLQKTNIIRDIREDWEDHRRFWPKEIWSKHVLKFDDLFDPAHQDSALNCSSEMVLNALAHADECLFYLAGIKEQSVFNFAAIPQTMAIATLALVFRNPNIFKKNVKISKGLACQMMVKSTQNLRVVCEAFREMAREIHKKNTPKDPNFLQISVACGKIEQFIESIYPTQDPRAIARRFNGEKSEEAGTNNRALWDVLYLFGAVGVVLFFVLFIMFGVAFIFGSKVDIDIIGFIRDIMGTNRELVESGHTEL